MSESESEKVRVYVAGVNAIGTGLYCCGSILVTVKAHNGKFHS